MEVMIEGVDDHSTQTAPREVTQFHGSLGIQGDAQHGLIGVRFLVDLMNLVEDGVGLVNLFQRTTFFTRFSP